MNFLFSQKSLFALLIFISIIGLWLLYEQKPEYFNVHTLLVALPFPVICVAGYFCAKWVATRQAKIIAKRLKLDVKNHLMKGLTTVENKDFQQWRLSQFELDAVEGVLKDLVEAEFKQLNYFYLRNWYLGFYFAGMLMMIVSIMASLLLPESGLFSKFFTFK